MAREPVRIFDTTLRDGLRNSGIVLGLAEKVRFARQLERLGLDAIEIGFGGPHEIDSMRAIAAAVGEPIVIGLSRVNRKDVDRVLRGVERARRPGVNVFQPTSEAFLAKAGTCRERALEASVRAVVHAKRHVDHVQFSAQDASRSDTGYLAELLAAVACAGATVLCITDTVSHAAPAQFGALCRELRARVATGEGVTWSVHCHNQRGLAVANCLAAVEQGIGQVECTVSGVGEGAGNTPLEGVLEALRDREPAQARISLGRLTETGELLRAISRQEIR